MCVRLCEVRVTSRIRWKDYLIVISAAKSAEAKKSLGTLKFSQKIRPTEDIFQLLSISNTTTHNTPQISDLKPVL